MYLSDVLEAIVLWFVHNPLIVVAVLAVLVGLALLGRGLSKREHKHASARGAFKRGFEEGLHGKRDDVH